MLDPNNSEVDAARIALLPLECSDKDLNKLFTVFDREKPIERLETYGLKALEGTGGPDEQPLVGSIDEIATFNAFTAIRVEFADPLPGTPYYDQFPENSAERRMMKRPLRNHPGLSRFTRDVRNHYVYNVLYAFQNWLGDELQNEIVAILAAPDSEWLSSPDNIPRTYQSPTHDPKEIADRITQYNDGFKIPLSHVLQRTFVEPIGDRLYLPAPDTEELPPITRHNDYLAIPTDVILAKLANYTWHGWYRLVHTLYNILPEDYVETLITATSRIGTEIKDHLKFRQPHRSFVPYYGSTAQNPLVNSNVRDPMKRPDKRLVTVTDTIRASSDLQFGEPIPLAELFNEVCRFFPSPDRPSNDVSNKQTLKNALNGALDDRIAPAEQKAAYEIPSPVPTPFSPSEGVRFWQQYRHELGELTWHSLELPNSRRISPVMPEEWWPRNSSDYTVAQQQTKQAAATQMKYDAQHLNTVKPFIDPKKVDALSSDEILFLTRVGLAMERRIKSYSLVESMNGFDKTAEGEQLDINFEKLDDQDYLNPLRGRRTYYSVPPETRKRLDIPNVSHDGWGERSRSEGTLHRVGIDLAAFFTASRPEVDRVVRYCDGWRLKNTACWDAVDHLENKRIDIIGFSKGEPQIVCEVETKSGAKADTAGAVKKLEAFPDDVHRLFIAPNGDHLRPLMSRLLKSGYFDIDFGEPKDGGYRPADVREKLIQHGIIGGQFDDLLTYDNIRTRLPESSVRSEFSDMIVGAI